MIVVKCEQGSPEWIAARIGLPTASSFDKILTPAGKPSKSADRYLARLTAEWFLGTSLDDAHTDFMDRGTQLEPQAAADYEFACEADTERVGLCLTDDRKAGASPDRLVGADGLLEIKVPSAEVHMMYVLDGPPSDYFVQVQGQLWVTGRKWVDLYCWHPTFPKVTKRYWRDDEFIGLLSDAVRVFVGRLDKAKADLAPAKADYEAKLQDDVPAYLST